MQAGQREQAFRAAHRLKGVCANLSFDRLGASASQLTELLRSEGDGVPEGAALVFHAVKQDYALTVDAIRAYLDAEQQGGLLPGQSATSCFSPTTPHALNC